MQGTRKMRRLAHVALNVCVLLALGCGKSTPPVDPAPFKQAIHAYLDSKSMALKVYEFKELTVDGTGNSANAVVSLEHAEGMVGVKVRWKFTFARRQGKWVATSHEQ